MKTTSLISLHSKAIKTLEAIEKAERQIAANEKYLADLKAEKAPWLDYVLKHTEERIETDKRIIDRLASMYSNLLVRIYRVAEATNPITLNDSENGAVWLFLQGGYVYLYARIRCGICCHDKEALTFCVYVQYAVMKL